MIPSVGVGLPEVRIVKIGKFYISLGESEEVGRVPVRGREEIAEGREIRGSGEGGVRARQNLSGRGSWRGKRREKDTKC